MGKFDGMLLVSDFDNTLLYTDIALRAQGECPEMSPRNVERIRYWIEEGGTFAVATGRAMSAYRTHRDLVPSNAPAIVDNGAAIYDYRSGEYVVTSFLPSDAGAHIRSVMDTFAGVSLELYHGSGPLLVMNPSPWNIRHATLTGLEFTVITDLRTETVPLPMTKALFVGDRAILEDICRFAGEQGWREQYELIFSSEQLLEMTARGANKGEMVKLLAKRLGSSTLICAGDHLNDLPMLAAADMAFCPANAEDAVKACGARVVCHCLEGAVGEIIEILDREIWPAAGRN